MAQPLPSHRDRCLPAGFCTTYMSWRQLYESALLELDSFRLRQRIVLARRAILDRAEEIMTKPVNDEQRSLLDALRTLRTLEEVAEREAADRGAA